MTRDDTLNYQNAPLRTSAWAVGVFVLSIVAAVGFFLIVPAIVMMVAAMIVRSHLVRRPNVEGYGLAHAAVQISGYSILLGVVTFMLLPSIGRERGSGGRSVCSANLRGTTQSMNVYASDNSDSYPVISPVGGYSLAAGGRGTPNVDPSAAIQSIYASPPAASVVQNMWLLVLTGQVAPKQFICKSDPAPPVNCSATNGTLYQTNFNDGYGKPSDFAYSYSFAYMWESTPARPVGSWWKNTTDASLPLMADMAPFNGTGSPPATPADPNNRNANSFNHQRDGQNIGYGDAHAEFARRPDIGQGSDNIFTHNGGVPSATGMPHTGGVPNVGNGGRPGAYDICMVPAADGTTNARR